MKLRWVSLALCIISFPAYLACLWMAIEYGGMWWFSAASWIISYTCNRWAYGRLTNEHRRRTGNYRSPHPSTSQGTDWSDYHAISIRAKDPCTGIIKAFHIPVWRHGDGVHMETKRQEDPIKGWKLANVFFNEDDGRVLFTPLVQSILYEPEGYAKCTFVEEVYRRLDIAKLEEDGWEISNDHGPVPSPDCTCGFYAMHKKNNTDEVQPMEWASIDSESWNPELKGFTAVGPCLLEVEFFGKIINAARGVRAEYQRVLCIYSYPPEGKDTSYPLPAVQVDWKWL